MNKPTVRQDQLRALREAKFDRVEAARKAEAKLQPKPSPKKKGKSK